MSDKPRRGWRETVRQGAGIYRAHRLVCPASTDRKPGRRCRCPFEFRAPGSEPGNRRTVTFYGTLTEARAERRRLLAEGRPEPIEQAAGPVTLNELAADVFRARAGSWAANTVRNREDDFHDRISPTLGPMPVGEVTRPVVEGWLAGLIAGGTSRRAIQQAVSTLRVFLGAAVDWDLIADNPARRLRIPRPDPAAVPAVQRVLDREQLAVLFAACKTTRTETMIRAAGEVGLRRGEVSGLRWPDIDLAARRVHVQRQVVHEYEKGQGHRKLVTLPKSGRTRRVAISDAYARRLADWYAITVVEGGADAQGYVWPGRNGGPMHNRSMGRALARACEHAGLLDQEGNPLVSPHRLRHSAASVMISEGVALPIVARQLGHANPNVTATTYSHMLGDEQLDLAAGIFDRSHGGGPGGGAEAAAKKALG